MVVEEHPRAERRQHRREKQDRQIEGQRCPAADACHDPGDEPCPPGPCGGPCGGPVSQRGNPAGGGGPGEGREVRS